MSRTIWWRVMARLLVARAIRAEAYAADARRRADHYLGLIRGASDRGRM